MTSREGMDSIARACYLGVDGGGTRTRAVVTDALGRVLGRGEGGASHAWVEGREAAERAVRTAAGAAVGAAEIDVPVTRACLAMASCAGPGAAGARWGDLARHVSVEHDAWASLVAALGLTEPGLVVQAGTGSVVVGRTAAAERLFRGGWGPLVGDEGSAYGIGAAGFRAAAHAVDRTGPATTLVEAIAGEWQVPWDGIREHLYRPGHRQRLASLAPVVVSLAATDDVACGVVSDQVDGLARQVVSVLTAISPGATVVHIALSGGVVHPPTTITSLLQSAVEESVAQEVRWHQGADAALGAATLARHQEEAE